SRRRTGARMSPRRCQLQSFGGLMAAVRNGNALVLGSTLAMAITMALAGTAVAQDDPAGAAQADATRTLDRISVTGSRIKRTDIEAALPVTIIQRQEIDAQGITSAEQLMQFLN